jgi:ubiquinone/menaquinone biosynthesis C-methylase UbiE
MSHQSQVTAESSDWQSAHYEEPYYSERTAKLLPKLKRLGILALPADTRILDACCGRGEALQALKKAGFRNLEGIDATPQPDRKGTGIVLHHGDVQNMPFPAASFDVVLNLHALHHMGGAEGVARFLSECHRVLKPQGILAIVDFPASPQVRSLFWLLRRKVFSITGGMRNFARILDEEWSYLHPYLQGWPHVKRALDRGPFTTVRNRRRFFLYYRVMRRA